MALRMVQVTRVRTHGIGLASIAREHSIGIFMGSRGFSSKVVCFFLKHIRLIQTYSHVIHVDSLIRNENLFQMLFIFILAFIRVIRL